MREREESVINAVGQHREVTAADIIVDSDTEFSIQIYTCNSSRECNFLVMEMNIASGRGYGTAEQNKVGATPVIQWTHSPVKKVNFTIENTRVGQVTDYDKLALSFGQMVQSLLRNPSVQRS